MGLAGLTSTKYLIYGNGQVRWWKRIKIISAMM
jgi:hypothetical protein